MKKVIQKYDGKIGTREFFTIVLFSIGTKLSDTTPVLLVKAGLNAAWIIPIISGLSIILPFLCLLSLLKLYNNKSLIDIIYHLTGKFFGTIIITVLLLINLEYLVITTRSYADILSTMFYLKTPIFFLLLLIITSSYLISSKEINIVGSVSWFTFPLLEIALLLLIPIILGEINLSYIFPLGGPGAVTLLKKGVINTTIVGEVIVLSIFFTKVRSYKEFRTASLLGLGVSVLQISLFMLIYTSTFGYPTLSIMNYPYQQLTRLIQIGRFASNAEALYLWFWAIGFSIRFGIYFYAAATISASFTRNKNPKNLLPFIVVLTFVIALIPENFTKYIFVFRQFGINYLWIYIIGLPFLLYAIARLKGEYKNEKN